MFLYTAVNHTILPAFPKRPGMKKKKLEAGPLRSYFYSVYVHCLFCLHVNVTLSSCECYFVFVKNINTCMFKHANLHAPCNVNVLFVLESLSSPMLRFSWLWKAVHTEHLIAVGGRGSSGAICINLVKSESVNEVQMRQGR